MAALSSSVERATAYPGQGYIATLWADADDTIYKGSLLAFNADGSVQVADNTDLVFAGISMEEKVVTASGTRIRVLCRTRVWLTLANADQDELGDLVIADNDNDLAVFADSRITVGRIVGVRGSGTSAEVLVDTAWQS